MTEYKRKKLNKKKYTKNVTMNVQLTKFPNIAGIK